MARWSTAPKPQGATPAATLQRVARVQRNAGTAPTTQYAAKVYQAPNTFNVAGGTAFKQSPELELAALAFTQLLSTKGDNNFYTTEKAQVERIKAAVQRDPYYAAQVAYSSRHEHGLRSISHVITACIAHYVKGQNWTKDFFLVMFRRVDDMMETVAAYRELFGVNYIPNALKAGIREAFNHFDRYSLAKYQGKDKDPSLADLMNLVHPVGNHLNRGALAALAMNVLKVEDTWEAELSAAGQTGASKAAVWRKLLANDDLGYLALLRNLRNIVETNDRVLIEAALERISDGKAIKKALILPFQLLTAYNRLRVDLLHNPWLGATLQALITAVDTATTNVKAFPGRLVVVMDQSGSMRTGRGVDEQTVAQIASLFSAVLLKSNPGADFVMFDDHGRYTQINTDRSIIKMKEQIDGVFTGGGTNHAAAVRTLNRAYDYIVWLSDEQGWANGRNIANSAAAELAKYNQRFNVSPTVFSFNLNSQDGTMQFPESQVVALAGWSFKTLDLLAAIQRGGEFMVTSLKAIDLKAKALERRVQLAERLKKLLPENRDTIDAATLAAKAAKVEAKRATQRYYTAAPTIELPQTPPQPGVSAQAALKRSEAARKAAATRKRNRELAVG
ncbi:MAG: TROVE domain-containing protein [Nitrosomonadaceae bacterium]|nr:TROVE domain-containing protein [Nitrosomonadaceae bacterium]